MAWTEQTWTVGQILTAAQMTNISDNFTAVADGDLGAPKMQTNAYSDLSVTESKIANSAATQIKVAANAIGQAEIKTVNQDISAVGGAAPTETLRTSAQYAFGGALARTSPADFSAVAIEFTYPPVGSTSFQNTSYMKITPNVGGTDTYFMRAYNVNSSPPYRSADGEILLFMFGIINDSSGILEGTCASIDPPWMYNGSTQTVADVKADGKGYIKKRLVEVEIPNWREMQLTGTLTNRKMISRRLKEDGFIYVEIDQAIKNADMNEVPHPFINVPVGKTVVYLDPVSKVMEDLYTHHNYGRADSSAPPASELLHSGNIIIDPQSDLNRDKPSSIRCVSIKWRNR